MAINYVQPSYESKLFARHKAAPIKCLDLDGTNDKLKLEGWLYMYIVLFLLTLFNTETPFYWEIQRGGNFLLSKFGRKYEDFFIYIQNYAGSWLELHFMVQALPGRAGRLDQVFLVVWLN